MRTPVNRDSRDRRSGPESDWAGAFESLEQRVLLSTGAEGATAHIAWGAAEVEVVPNSWLLTFDGLLGAEGAFAKAMEVLHTMGAVADSVLPIGRGGFAQVISRDPISIASAAWVVEQVPGLLAFEPDLIYQPAAVPNDPLFTEQWAHSNLGQFIVDPWFIGFGAPGADVSSIAAWDRTIGTHDVIVAVVDTGVDYNHPDLRDNIWSHPGEIPGNGIDDDGNGFIDDVRGWDFGEFNNDPMDVYGHGTPVAGLIGAVGNNGIGIAGVAWNVSIMPIKIADRFGRLSAAAVIGAHDYLGMMIERGHNIVASNNSYGAFAPAFYEEEFPEGLFGERQAIQRFIDAGGTFVASAGNAANDNDATFTSFPASYDIPAIISVAATDPNDGLAVFSNWGAKNVDIGAPGVSVLSTAVGGGYTPFGGTSGAGPIVAGAVALLKSLRPDASAIEVKEALINSADPIPALQGRAVSGGRLNIAEALRIVGLAGPVVRSISPGPLTVGSSASIVIEFSEPVNPAFVNAGAVSLIASGGDGIIGNGNDVVRAIDAVELGNGNRLLTITPAQPLGAETYRLTLDPSGFRDELGNFLNGGFGAGDPEVYTFRIAGLGANFETNDTLAAATPLAFSANGTASVSGVLIGDGAFQNLDVDIYRIDMPRGGLITVRVDAANLPNPSDLDAYLRLFDPDGKELVSNDQFNGNDPFIDYFVTTGGQYYVGVSGFSNTNYNPLVGGSGSSQSTGAYTLTATVDLVANDTRFFFDALAGPVPVPDQGVIQNTILVTDNRLLLDLNVWVNLNHDFVEDLRVSLISPNGREVVLMNAVGGDGQFQPDPDNPVPVLFDDEAGTKIGDANAPYGGGVFRPVEPLSKFDGENALGLWTLRVQDTAFGNTGALHGWSMRMVFQNNIFGPFELNDTIPTARPLDQINGAGSAVRQASIGDGGYGTRDVDLYRFTAAAGSTLNAVVQSDGVVNLALRVFDATGQELKRASPEGTLGAAISRFVFNSGGVYYIGVSEAATAAGDGAYDPFKPGSGPAAATTGRYRLTVNVASGVSDADFVLPGGRITAGMSGSGTFGDGQTGLRFKGIEFLYNTKDPGSPATAYFGARASGHSFQNDGVGGYADVPMSTIVQNDAQNRRVTGIGEFRGLMVERSISYGVADDFMVIDVSLRNTTADLMTGVAWMEAFNPNQGLNVTQGSALTRNDVLNGKPYASARFQNNVYQQGLTVAMAAPEGETRAIATFVNPLAAIRDPGQILAIGVNDPNGALADRVMALAYDLGDLAPGAETTMRYFIFFGETPQAPMAMYNQLNAGTGAGHLTLDPSAPVNDAAGLPLMPYRLYYPEGYANGRASTFVPVTNGTNEDARVVIIARYETGERDQVLFDGVVQAQSRGGITITTPEMYANDTLLVRKDTPYALEVRSSVPVSATMSHYDFGASTGEAFTSESSKTWSFARVTKGQGSNDFVVFHNTSDQAIKILTVFYPEGGGTPIELHQTVGANRRGGWNLDAETRVPAGTYGVVVHAARAVVAAVSSYTEGQSVGYGALAVPGLGSTGGAMPEGQFGIKTDRETISILNATGTAATVVFTFSFDNGSSYRHELNVGPGSHRSFDLRDLSFFQAGRPYAVSYVSNTPVSVATPTLRASQPEGAAFSSKAYTYWSFAEGFRPAGNTDQVNEYLRIYNPSHETVVVDIKIRYADGATETFRRVIGAGRVANLDVHTLITGKRRQNDQFYGLTVKSATPIVAFMGRTDAFFPGAWGSMGTASGLEGSLG